MLELPVKEQFRPTLPDILAPRWERLSPRGRRLAKLAAGALVALAVALAILLPRDPWIVYNGRPLRFNLQYPRVMHRVAAPPGAYALAEQRSHGRLIESVEAAPLSLPSYSGDVNAEFPVYASGYITALAARTPGFKLSSEGHTHVDTLPGYWLAYSGKLDGHVIFGRVVFLVPHLTGSRRGVTLVILSEPRANVGDPDQVAVNGELYEPLHSFRFLSAG